MSQQNPETHRFVTGRSNKGPENGAVLLACDAFPFFDSKFSSHATLKDLASKVSMLVLRVNPEKWPYPSMASLHLNCCSTGKVSSHVPIFTTSRRSNAQIGLGDVQNILPRLVRSFDQLAMVLCQAQLHKYGSECGHFNLNKHRWVSCVWRRWIESNGGKNLCYGKG